MLSSPQAQLQLQVSRGGNLLFHEINHGVIDVELKKQRKLIVNLILNEFGINKKDSISLAEDYYFQDCRRKSSRRKSKHGKDDNNTNNYNSNSINGYVHPKRNSSKSSPKMKSLICQVVLVQVSLNIKRVVLVVQKVLILHILQLIQASHGKNRKGSQSKKASGKTHGWGMNMGFSFLPGKDNNSNNKNQVLGTPKNTHPQVAALRHNNHHETPPTRYLISNLSHNNDSNHTTTQF